MKFSHYISLFLASVALVMCKSAELKESLPTMPVGAGATKLGPAKLAALTNPALNNAASSSRFGFVVRRVTRQINKVSWNSLAHEENQGFIVQRSVDGITWTNVYFQPGEPDKRERAFSYSDTTAASVYYRLGELDEAMHMTYSPVWYLVAATPLARFGAQLNPVKRSVQLVGSDPTKPVDVLNSAGEVVQVVVGTSFSTRELRPGTYAVRQGSRVTRLQVH